MDLNTEDKVAPALKSAAEEVMRAANRAGLSWSDALAVARSVTGHGPDVRLVGGRVAVANAVGVQVMAGVDPVELIAEIERLMAWFDRE